MIRIRFFASLRERLNLSTFNYDYMGERTVEELLSELLQKNDDLQLLQEKDVLVAVNQTLCGKDARINDGDEVAFFPPVTGG